MGREKLYVVSYKKKTPYMSGNIIYIGYDKDKALELHDYYGRNNTRIDWFRECDITEKGGVKL